MIWTAWWSVLKNPQLRSYCKNYVWWNLKKTRQVSRTVCPLNSMELEYLFLSKINWIVYWYLKRYERYVTYNRFLLLDLQAFALVSFIHTPGWPYVFLMVCWVHFIHLQHLSLLDSFRQINNLLCLVWLNALLFSTRFAEFVEGDSWHVTNEELLDYDSGPDPLPPQDYDDEESEMDFQLASP